MYAADLHLHSPYARATSRQLSFENLVKWAKIKGIDLLASADFTHPVWFAETERTLNEAEDGLYEYEGVRFVLGTEVSCVGVQGGKGRRVHVLVFAPCMRVAALINAALSGLGDLAGDGRPMLRMTPYDLLGLLLGIDERIVVIPAHVWTPWFGVYGSKSGFDSLEECFGDLTEHIYAIETGLSSDPAMNWRIPEFDDVAIVSFSDAHSLPKMGRELTIFDGEMTYAGLVQSLKEQRIAYTVEFFPEEGKYHYSGHRKCGVRLSPPDVERTGRVCPVCGRAMTLGVMQRVEELAQREVCVQRNVEGVMTGDGSRPAFRSLVGLQQIIAETMGRGVNTKGVRERYMAVVNVLGSELDVLTKAAVSDIAAAAGEQVAEGVERVRAGHIRIVPGYDGVFGEVSVW